MSNDALLLSVSSDHHQPQNHEHHPQVQAEVDDIHHRESIRILLGYGREHDGYYSLVNSSSTEKNSHEQSLPLPPPTPSPPPPPLRPFIETKLWKRFRGHMASVHLRGMVTGATVVWPLWLLTFIVFNVFDLDRYDFVFIPYIIFTFLVVGASFYSTWLLQPRDTWKQYSRVVDKMQPTFNARGYHVTLGSFMEFGCLRRRYYVVFVRDPSLVIESQNVPVQQEEDDCDNEEQWGPYHPPDWYPLEGTWTKVNETIPSLHFFAFFRSVFKESSLVWTITGTRSPETFAWERTATGYLFGAFPRTVVTRSQVVRKTGSGNHDDSSNVEYFNAVEYVPSKPLSSRLHQVLRTSTRLQPLPMDDGDHQQRCQTHAYYLQGEQSIWHVTGPTTLKKYDFIFLEDMPSRQEILNGVLERSEPADLADTCMVWQFERTSLEPMPNYSGIS